MLAKFIVRAIFGALGLWLSSVLVAGVHFSDTGSLILAAVLLGIVNAFVRPVVFVLTLPMTVVTLGLFLLIVNAAMIGLVAMLLSRLPGARPGGGHPGGHRHRDHQLDRRHDPARRPARRPLAAPSTKGRRSRPRRSRPRQHLAGMLAELRRGPGGPGGRAGEADRRGGRAEAAAPAVGDVHEAAGFLRLRVVDNVVQAWPWARRSRRWCASGRGFGQRHAGENLVQERRGFRAPPPCRGSAGRSGGRRSGPAGRWRASPGRSRWARAREVDPAVVRGSEVAGDGARPLVARLGGDVLAVAQADREVPAQRIAADPHQGGLDVAPRPLRSRSCTAASTPASVASAVCGRRSPGGSRSARGRAGLVAARDARCGSRSRSGRRPACRRPGRSGRSR